MDGIDAAAAIGGTDIRKVMKSQGPIVNTVILRCPSTATNDGHDSKPAAVETKPASGHTDETNMDSKPRIILKDLIEELKIDTTPSKSKVAEVLGGPFTFLGQYEDEGIILMVRNLPDDLEADLRDIYENGEEESNDGREFSFAEQLSKNFNIKALKAVCFQRDIDTESMTEKQELVDALVEYQKSLPPYNTHQLQPPLHKARVRGDIVVMKVAETDEEMDNKEGRDGSDLSNKKTVTSNEGDNAGALNPQENKGSNPIEGNEDASTNVVASIPSNEEFFLDYNKDAYIKFASRTDIPEHEIKCEEHGEEGDEEDDDGENGEATISGVHDGGDEDDDDDDDEDEEANEESDKNAMFNLVMNEVLRQYREENGRGPNTQELLELRSNIAKELGVEISQDIDGDWDKMAKENQVPSAKKIFFTKEADRVREYVPDANEYPSDRGEDEEEDEDYIYSDDVARSLEGDYDKKEDGDHINDRPSKKIKTSHEEKNSQVQST